MCGRWKKYGKAFAEIRFQQVACLRLVIDAAEPMSVADVKSAFFDVALVSDSKSNGLTWHDLAHVNAQGPIGHSMLLVVGANARFGG